MERCVKIDHYYKKVKKKKTYSYILARNGYSSCKGWDIFHFHHSVVLLFLICPSAGDSLTYVLCIIICDQYIFFFKNCVFGK